MPEVHAILSASSSKRWLNCTPSARLEQNFPNESSVYAEEGTAAHALGEYKLRKYLHERVQRPTSEYENEEMEANTDIYAEFIISTVERIKETCPHPLVMVEERLDYSYLVPSGFGTGDCVIIADGTLYVMDYKNGKGVFVSCDHNPQMMLYALGAYHAYFGDGSGNSPATGKPFGVHIEYYRFLTEQGLPLKYTVEGGEIFFNRKEKSVTRSSVMMAFKQARRIQETEGCVSGPKKLGTFGASYLYPVFLRIGVCSKKI